MPFVQYYTYVEITPREAGTLPPLSGVLAPGTAVYITFLPRTPWEDTLAAARWRRAQRSRVSV